MAISNGILGYLGVKPEEYAQAQSLINAGIPSLRNADRLSYLSQADFAKRATAGNAGLKFLNGDAITPGGAGRQNQNTNGFSAGTAGGVQSSQMTSAPSTNTATPTNPQTNVTGPSNSAIVDALRQKPQRFEGFGMGLTPTGFNKTPNGLFQSI